MRSDLALIDPASRQDVSEFTWPLVARPAFGGMRPSAVRWIRMPLPGWFVEEGWSLTPETSGMAGLMGRGPHLAPITAMIRRRSGAARMLIGGRNLAGPNDPAAHFTMSIDGVAVPGVGRIAGFLLEGVRHPRRPPRRRRAPGRRCPCNRRVRSGRSRRRSSNLTAGRTGDDVGLWPWLAGSRVQHGARRLAMDQRSCNRCALPVPRAQSGHA